MVHPSRAAVRATRSIPCETVSANLDAHSKTDYPQADQARLFPCARVLVANQARHRQILLTTDAPKAKPRAPGLC